MPTSAAISTGCRTQLRTGPVVEITALRALLAHPDGDHPAVALPGHHPAGGVEIEDVTVELAFFGDAPRDGERVGHRWALIPGHDVLTVGNLKARIQVEAPLDPDYRFPRVDVTGEIAIKGDGDEEAVIELTARWPDYAVSGVLREGDTIPLGHLLAELGVPAGKHPESLVIDRLSLQAEPVFTPRSFSLWLEIKNGRPAEGEMRLEDAWPIELGSGKTLTIEEVGGAIDYRGGDDGRLTGRLYGRVPQALNIVGYWLPHIKILSPRSLYDSFCVRLKNYIADDMSCQGNRLQ